MNTLILSTYDLTGGAAIAAHRLAEALNNNGVKARMMVLFRKGDSPYVIPVGSNNTNRWRKMWERGVIWMAHAFSKKALFETSIANTGVDITHTQEFKQADIIHLHWTCQGLLSLNGLKKILQSGKPVIWTMHDMWPLTAICHYTRGCQQCNTACSDCPQESMHNTLHRFVANCWKKKKAIYDLSENLTFVTCSNWLAAQAKNSALIGQHRVVSIPNTINTHLFRKQDKTLARRRLGLPLDKHLLLFVAQSVTDKRKGMHHLVDVLHKLCRLQPEIKDSTEVVILGGKTEELVQQLPLRAHHLGYIHEVTGIVDAYNAADIFVIPSTEDNLPNTIMEAMACGVPCIGFNIGGIPEMIDHHSNGYVAAVKADHHEDNNHDVPVDTDDMAAGLLWMLTEANTMELSAKALAKVHTTYAQQHVANLYIKEYQRLCPEEHVDELTS